MDVPEAILSGGRTGWPAVLSGLKSLLETGTAPVNRDGAAKGNDRGDQAAENLTSKRLSASRH